MQLKVLHESFYNPKFKKYSCNSTLSYSRKSWVGIPSYIIIPRLNFSIGKSVFFTLVIFPWLTNENSVSNLFLNGIITNPFGILPLYITPFFTTTLHRWQVVSMSKCKWQPLIFLTLELLIFLTLELKQFKNWIKIKWWLSAIQWFNSCC